MTWGQVIDIRSFNHIALKAVERCARVHKEVTVIGIMIHHQYICTVIELEYLTAFKTACEVAVYKLNRNAVGTARTLSMAVIDLLLTFALEIQACAFVAPSIFFLFPRL